MKVYYLFTLCLFKVGRLFSKIAIPKYMFVFVIKLSKEKTYFTYGWTWEIEHKMYCLLHNCLCEILHLIFTVVCQMSTLYCGGGSRNMSCMPRCRFNVLNVQLQKYIYYWSLEIFKSTFCSYLFFFVLGHIALLVASLVVARKWSLAWAWYKILLLVHPNLGLYLISYYLLH